MGCCVVPALKIMHNVNVGREHADHKHDTVDQHLHGSPPQRVDMDTVAHTSSDASASQIATDQHQQRAFMLPPTNDEDIHRVKPDAIDRIGDLLGRLVLEQLVPRFVVVPVHDDRVSGMVATPDARWLSVVQVIQLLCHHIPPMKLPRNGKGEVIKTPPVKELAFVACLESKRHFA